MGILTIGPPDSVDKRSAEGIRRKGLEGVSPWILPVPGHSASGPGRERVAGRSSQLLQVRDREDARNVTALTEGKDREFVSSKREQTPVFTLI